jgi:hypothetical protein
MSPRVDALDRVRRRHDAAPVVAVAKAEGVPEFVQRFPEKALRFQDGIGGQTVKLFPEPVG